MGNLGSSFTQFSISFLLASRTKDETDGVGRGQELTYSQASGIKMEDLINEYLTSDSNVSFII